MSQLLKCRLRKVTWNSIREIEELELPLQDGVNLVQIRNGYGKTTTLYLLRTLFTGVLPTPEQFPRYKRRHGGNRDSSRFSAHLEIENASGEMRPWTVSIIFDHEAETAIFETSSPEIGGVEPGWRLPIEFKSKFQSRERFAELFLFDGETAKDLCKKQGHDQIEQAIRELTGLAAVYQHVQGMDAKVVKVRDAALEQQSINDVTGSHARWLAWSSELKQHVQALEILRKQKKAEVKKLDAQIAALESDLRELEASQRVDGLIAKRRDNVRNLHVELATETGELLSALCNPLNVAPTIWTRVREFHTGLLEARVPEGVGRSFFFEILGRPTCICGQPWTPEMQDAIRSRVDEYLGDEILSVVKSMQSRVRDDEFGDHAVRASVAKINELRIAIATEEQEIENLKATVDEEARAGLQNLEDQADEKREARKLAQELVDEISGSDPAVIRRNRWDMHAVGANGEPLIQPARFKNCKNLHVLKRVERTLNEKQASTTDLIHLDRGVNAALEVYEEALEAVMESLRTRLQEKTNSLLADMPAAGGGIEVRFNAQGLVFVDEYGEEQPSANMGAILAGAYAFIGAMSDLGSVDVPLVVDSPVTGLDLVSAEAWCTTIWPYFKQLVAFITPGERALMEGRAAGRERVYDATVKRVTLHRRDEGVGGKPQQGSMIVNSRQDWFRSYQVQEKQEEE